jgi:hypothetical protein
MPIHKPENILIVKLSAIGDVIHTLPALNMLRKIIRMPAMPYRSRVSDDSSFFICEATDFLI